MAKKRKVSLADRLESDEDPLDLCDTFEAERQRGQLTFINDHETDTSHRAGPRLRFGQDDGFELDDSED